MLEQDQEGPYFVSIVLAQTFLHHIEESLATFAIIETGVHVGFGEGNGCSGLVSCSKELHDELCIRHPQDEVLIG